VTVEMPVEAAAEDHRKGRDDAARLEHGRLALVVSPGLEAIVRADRNRHGEQIGILVAPDGGQVLGTIANHTLQDRQDILAARLLRDGRGQRRPHGRARRPGGESCRFRNHEQHQQRAQ
jgi:hypothetical protein